LCTGGSENVGNWVDEDSGSSMVNSWVDVDSASTLKDLVDEDGSASMAMLNNCTDEDCVSTLNERIVHLKLAFNFSVVGVVDIASRTSYIFYYKLWSVFCYACYFLPLVADAFQLLVWVVEYLNDKCFREQVVVERLWGQHQTLNSSSLAIPFRRGTSFHSNQAQSA